MSDEHVVIPAPGVHSKNAGAQGTRFLSLQEAIDFAEEGDTIFVYPGTYVGNVVVNKALLTIRSSCIDDCIIAGHVQVLADDLTMEHLTVAGGPGASGILVNGARDCKFNTVRCAGNLNGMEFVGSEDNHVTSCEFIGNVGYGLKLTAASNDNEVKDCFATGNGHGFGEFDSLRNRLFDNAAHTNTGIGLHVVRCLQSTIQSQMSQYNAIGVCFDESDLNTFFTGNVQWNGIGLQFINSDNNLVYSTPIQLQTGTDITVDAASNTNTIAHNFYNTKIDLGVGTRWQNNHLNSPAADGDVATVGYVKALSYLATPVTNVLYVDNKRTDIYVENGSITKPFKLVQAAHDAIIGSSIANRFEIRLVSGTYSAEVLVLSADFITIAGESCSGLSGAITIPSPHVKFKELDLRSAVTLSQPSHFLLEVVNCSVGTGIWNITATAPTGDEYLQVLGDDMWTSRLNATGIRGVVGWSGGIVFGGPFSLTDCYFQSSGSDMEGITINLEAGTEAHFGGLLTGLTVNLKPGANLYADADALGGMTVVNTGGVLHKTTALTDVDQTVTRVNAATYNLLVTDQVLHVDYTITGPVTNLRLMSAQCVDGRRIEIKDSGCNAGVNSITVTTEGAEKIINTSLPGSDTFVISANGDAYFLTSRGGHWYVS